MPQNTSWPELWKPRSWATEPYKVAKGRGTQARPCPSPLALGSEFSSDPASHKTPVLSGYLIRLAEHKLEAWLCPQSAACPWLTSSPPKSPVCHFCSPVTLLVLTNLPSQWRSPEDAAQSPHLSTPSPLLEGPLAYPISHLLLANLSCPIASRPCKELSHLPGKLK